MRVMANNRVESIGRASTSSTVKVVPIVVTTRTSMLPQATDYRLEFLQDAAARRRARPRLLCRRAGPRG